MKFCDGSVTHALSILDPAMPDPEPFLSFEGNRTVLRFHDIIEEEEEREAPQEHHIEAILSVAEAAARHGREEPRILVHCHMGISRSTAAVAILLAQRHRGAEHRVYEELRRIRPCSWPNSRMIALADRMLGRNGALLDALRPHQRLVLREFPEIADLVTRIGRAHEL